MTQYTIFTPNPQFSGERAGVTFTAGQGATTDASRAEELRRMGYQVREEPREQADPADSTTSHATDEMPPEPQAAVTGLKTLKAVKTNRRTTRAKAQPGVIRPETAGA